jgi:hypothetical protein
METTIIFFPEYYLLGCLFLLGMSYFLQMGLKFGSSPNYSERLVKVAIARSEATRKWR